MAGQQKLDQIRTIICLSSGIENWKEKILKRYKAREYIWWQDLFKPVIFFGFYNPKQWLKFLIHRGLRTVHWCGSDIFMSGTFWTILSRLGIKVKARHICENEVEQGVLRLMLQQEIEIRPTFLSNPHEFKVSYKERRNPQVWIHINYRAEMESGLKTLKNVVLLCPEITFHIYGKVRPQELSENVVWHGYVSENNFNEEIKEYQAGLRLHEFDGMSEVMTKSILLGQYPISRIRYPYIDTYKDEKELVELLKNLKNKKKPNYKVRDYYLKEFLKKYE